MKYVKEQSVSRVVYETVRTTIRPSQVYANESARTLEAYQNTYSVRVVDFRPPAYGERFIEADWNGRFNAPVSKARGDNATEPRFIVTAAIPMSHNIWE